MEKMAWISYLRELNVLSLTLRIVLAVFCGGIIGYERGKHQEAAGFRTHTSSVWVLPAPCWWDSTW